MASDMRTQWQEAKQSGRVQSAQSVDPALFDRARAALRPEKAEPIRCLHHFACSGGTLISRMVAAQPNIRLLSEVDPLSPLMLKRVKFAPRDLLSHAMTGLRPPAQDDIVTMFMKSLKELQSVTQRSGQRLVLRDHPHSHYCTSVDPASRPSVHAMLRDRFDLLGVVTVRHPIDSYLALGANNWRNFEPATLDTYAQRYMLFLDDHAQLPVFAYEAFVADPEAEARKIIDILQLPFNPNWQAYQPLIGLSGDSGRSGFTISPRPRRPVPDDLAEEAATSGSYADLCARLGYNPDVTASPMSDMAGA